MLLCLKRLELLYNEFINIVVTGLDKGTTKPPSMEVSKEGL